jgi:hypothetical protein
VTRKTIALAAAVLFLGVSGCSVGGSDEGGDMHVDGDCGLGENLPLTSLISDDQLERLLGSGDYTAEPGLVVKAGKVPPEFGGQCAVTTTGTSSSDRLHITLIPKSDPGYASYRSTLETGDLAEKLGTDGYVVSEHAEDADGEDATGARAAIIEPERVVVLRVLVPAAGADTVKEAGVAVRSLADNLHHLG